MTETKQKKLPLDRIVYWLGVVGALAFIVPGLAHIVQMQNVKMREVMELFLKNYAVWGVLVFVVCWIASWVIDRKMNKTA